MKISEFQDWVNHPVTCAVRNHLVEEAKSYDSISGSTLVEKNAYSDSLTPLEQIGFFTAMRMATIKGIEVFTDTNSLMAGLQDAEIVEVAEDE